MHKTPNIAILLTTYNGELFLQEQLDSILAQTYKNFKIYISDDNSTDATKEILIRYKLQNPDKFFYSFNDINLGFVKNFEKLLQESEAGYIALSDQDDVWKKDKLELELKEMLKLETSYKNRACMVHTDLSMIDKKGKMLHASYFKYRKYKLKSSKDIGHILGPCGVMGNTILINQRLRDLVLPFPKNLDTHDYWIAVNCEFFGIRKTIFKSLVKYRIHDGNSSNSTEKLTNSFSIFNQDIKLPNLKTNRKFFLPSLDKKVISASDRVLFDTYLAYLNFEKNRVEIYFGLLRYSLVKRDFFFRARLFVKMIFCKKT